MSIKKPHIFPRIPTTQSNGHVEIADNDPHRKKIVELIKEILSDHSINYLSDLSIILDRKLESTGVKFYTDLPTITSISGELNDKIFFPYHSSEYKNQYLNILTQKNLHDNNLKCGRMTII